jgi:hypothetical protein
MRLASPSWLGALVAGTIGSAMAQGAATTSWTFLGDQPNASPAGFSFGRTGSGRMGQWVVRLDPGAPAGDHVLAQIDADDTDYRFPVAVADAPLLKDLPLEVHCKPVSGKTDQACGLVFRYRDENNYYVARGNALEDNVRLYRVVEGRRRQIGGWNGKVPGGTWHAMAVEARGDDLKVLWDGKQVLQVADATFQQAGKVGLWTKADSVTYFAGLAATARFEDR